MLWLWHRNSLHSVTKSRWMQQHAVCTLWSCIAAMPNIVAGRLSSKHQCSPVNPHKVLHVVRSLHNQCCTIYTSQLPSDGPQIVNLRARNINEIRSASICSGIKVTVACKSATCLAMTKTKHPLTTSWNWEWRETMTASGNGTGNGKFGDTWVVRNYSTFLALYFEYDLHNK